MENLNKVNYCVCLAGQKKKAKLTNNAKRFKSRTEEEANAVTVIASDEGLKRRVQSCIVKDMMLRN